MVTRERLLDVARQMFSEDGYAAVSRADIARRAGVGMSTIYHHFPEKKDLLLALIDEWASALPVERRSALDVQTALGGEIRRAARDFLRHSFEQLRHGPSFYRVILTEAERDPEVRRRYELAQRAITNWLAQMVSMGQHGEILLRARRPEPTAFLLHNVIESTLTTLVGRSIDPSFRDEVLDELAEMICWYLTGRPDDPGKPAGS